MTTSRPTPPLHHTSVPGSYARQTFEARIPGLLDQVRRDQTPAPPGVEAALGELADEVRRGRLRLLREQTPDRPFWDEAAAPHVGASWLNLPWFFAEAFFYRRLLEATGYFGNGPSAARDPFRAAKAGELLPGRAPRSVAQTLSTLSREPRARLRALLYASLWGNRADLSHESHHLGTGSAAADLVVDDADLVLERWFSDRVHTVIVLADNAGTELAFDLALVAELLEQRPTLRVELHVKVWPTFVSDAIPADVAATRQALAADPGAAPVASVLQQHQAKGRFLVREHPFYNTSLFFTHLPPTLRDDLGRADLVIVKGDANYRRLCVDAPWPHELAFADVVAHFPAPVVALRALKSEVLVGLPEGLAPRIAVQDPRWFVNGKRAVIQARL